MDQKSISILALGDSYTIGEGVAENQSWPTQLKVALSKERIDLIELNIIARTGWTTGDLLEAVIEKKLTNVPYDLVFLLIGVNNQYRGYALNAYRIEFRKLLTLSIDASSNNPKHVFVISIPDWANTPFADGKDKNKISRDIDEFNNVNQEESANEGVNYIDITDITRQSPLDASMLSSDQLHPSGKMYSLWVERIFKAIKSNIPN